MAEPTTGESAAAIAVLPFENPIRPPVLLAQPQRQIHCLELAGAHPSGAEATPLAILCGFVLAPARGAQPSGPCGISC